MYRQAVGRVCYCQCSGPMIDPGVESLPLSPPLPPSSSRGAPPSSRPRAATPAHSDYGRASPSRSRDLQCWAAAVGGEGCGAGGPPDDHRQQSHVVRAITGLTPLRDRVGNHLSSQSSLRQYPWDSRIPREGALCTICLAC